MVKTLITRVLILVTLFGATPVQVLAQVSTPPPTGTFVRLQRDSTSGLLDSTSDSIELPLRIGAFGAIKIQTLDSYSGTWEVLCSTDGGDNYGPDPLTLIKVGESTPVTSVTDEVSIWTVTDATGCTAILIDPTAGFAASNTTVVISATQAGGAGGTGGGGGGSFNGVLLDAAGGDPLTDTTADALRAFLVDANGDPLPLAEDDVTGEPAVGSGPENHGLFADFDDSALPTLADVEGDAIPEVGSAVGVRYVMITNEDGSKTPIVQEDGPHSTGGGLMGIAAVRRDVAVSSTATDAEYATFNTDALGLLWTRNGDPCSSASTKLYLPIDITTATTTEITPALAGASTHYYICALNLVTDAANDVSIVDDNSDNCASVTAGLIGGLTAAEGWNFAANGGLTLGNGTGSVMRTVTANSVICIVTSAATQLAGQMVVVAAP